MQGKVCCTNADREGEHFRSALGDSPMLPRTIATDPLSVRTGKQQSIDCVCREKGTCVQMRGQETWARDEAGNYTETYSVPVQLSVTLFALKSSVSPINRTHVRMRHSAWTTIAYIWSMYLGTLISCAPCTLYNDIRSHWSNIWAMVFMLVELFHYNYCKLYWTCSSTFTYTHLHTYVHTHICTYVCSYVCIELIVQWHTLHWLWEVILHSHHITTVYTRRSVFPHVW